MAGPLSGVRVVDLTSVVSGPFATMFLADQGADVIKVEPPVGDMTRRTRPPIDDDGQFSPMFISTNRGKRSISLDLKRPEGVEALRKLIARSDVLVQNFRPQVMERLGLGEAAVRALNPRLIYVSISGVGDSGPYAGKRVYDPIIQGLSGFADVQAQAGTRRPQMIRAIVADKTTSVMTAQAITAALYARERTGVGQHVKVAMLDAMIAFLWPEAMTNYVVVGREAPAGDHNARPDLVFATIDGYITAGTISDSEWAGFCKATDRPDLLDDERFNSQGKRAANATERITLMGEILATRTTENWLKRLDDCDVPCAPVLRRAEVLTNEQVVARELIAEYVHSGVGRVRQARPAAQFSATPGRAPSAAPWIGQHSREILAELGYGAEEIDGLANTTVIREVKG
ncbi:MAG: CaiB/BaiF CoA transferase family protein [Reyranella sp.]|uniref:CaiB/BaiF CoA transferase family protein n=1 Tax=Reyranella sp. TaxID=1929291 RepID=UPI003D0E79D8